MPNIDTILEPNSIDIDAKPEEAESIFVNWEDFNNYRNSRNNLAATFKVKAEYSEIEKKIIFNKNKNHETNFTAVIQCQT